MGLQTFKQLARVPVHYDRYPTESGAGYGTRGKPFSPRATERMVEALGKCFADIFKQAPFGAGEVITSAGAYVDKPGHHGRGEAFDLDGIFWKDIHLVAIEYPAKPHLYLAVESILRQHFGTVLAYNYNLDHRDHFHMDLGTPVGFQKMSKSRVEYLQASLLYVHGFQVDVDGVWGPSTEQVVKAALADLGLKGVLTNKQVWVDYLKATTPRAFALV